MKSISQLSLTVTAAILSLTISAQATLKSNHPMIISHEPLFSEIKDYDYVCYHVAKQEALVFKTSAPQKIWRTNLNKEGQIKTSKAFQLNQVSMNSENINKDGQVASFKGSLAKDYEIKGLFEKESDGELPLTVVSSYLPDGTTSQIKDHYNCEAQKENLKIQLGHLNKTTTDIE